MTYKKHSFSLSQLTIPQRMIFFAGASYRFRVVVAGRRFGKTCLAITEAIYEAQRGPNRLIWYIAPTYRQAKDLVWEELKAAIPKDNILKINETELSITLRGYNSKIVLKGADNADSLRGKGLNFVIFDEAADVDPVTWYEVIYPALTDKRGSALFIGTPKGYNWFYDIFQLGNQQDLNWVSFQYTTEQGGNVAKSELEYARQNMSERQYAQEFLASFETMSNIVYSAFSRHYNVDESVIDYRMPIHIGMDFNINPMSAVIGSLLDKQIHIFDEIEIPNGNTEEMCEEIISRYYGRDITVYPDPSGNTRKTSAPVGQTDFTILKSYGFKLISPKKAPLVVDRINEVNAMCRTADGNRKLFVAAKCKSLIKGLDGSIYKEGTSQPDKTMGLDHMPDALGYLVHSVSPINRKELKKIKILGF